MERHNELMYFGKLWDQAMVCNDAEEISKFMSDEWVLVETEGGITPKSAFLTSLKSGDLTHNIMSSGDVRVKIYGEMGLLTSRGTSSGRYKDQPFCFYEWSTSVFIRERGNWKCVLTMLTPALK